MFGYTINSMGFFRDGQNWVVGSVGVLFVLVGASKWLYDMLILNNFTYGKIYLVMITLGGVSSGYSRLEKTLEKIIS